MASGGPSPGAGRIDRVPRVSPPSAGLRIAGGVVGACLLALSGFGYTTAGEGPSGGASAGSASALDAGLADLDSPYLATRTAAIDALRRLDASARPALREAFRRAPEARRARLARVLAAGADVEDLGLVLDALTAAKDPATVAALRDVLVEHAELSETVIAARRAAGGATPAAWASIEELLARARLEALFLSRKSLSGGTGSYDGQYAALRPWRKPALELCIAMLAETEVRRPGVYPVGTYRFLRPPPVLVQHEEVREMAANAIAELCTADDASILDRLEAVHGTLLEEMRTPGDENRVKRLIASGLDDIVLPTLVTLGRARRFELELRVEAHENEEEYADAAHLRLRMKQFEAAVQLFQNQIRRRREHVIPSYNLACAYARWSEAAAKDAALATRLREGAVRALEESYAYGYADWAWMEQDLDLQAIRGMDRYRALVAEMKRRFPPPSTWLGAGGKAPAGSGAPPAPASPASPPAGAAPSRPPTPEGGPPPPR